MNRFDARFLNTGTNPDQIPQNKDLGALAYQDDVPKASNSEAIAGIDSTKTITSDKNLQAYFSWIRDDFGKFHGISQPTLNLFCDSVPDDSCPIGTFTRTGYATRRGPTGSLELVSNNLIRKDWDNSGKLLGWLLEEQRTNYCLGNTSGSIASWGSDGITFATGFHAPDGTNNGVKLTATSNVALVYITLDIPYHSNEDDYYPMIFLKRGNQRYATLNIFYNSLAESNAYIDFDNATIINEAYAGETTIDKFIDDWYRVGYRMLRNNSGGSLPVSFRVWPNIRDSVAIGDYCYAFGPSLEYGAFPTSFIYPGASAVTRPADSWTIPTSAFAFNYRAGAVFFSGDMLHYDVSSYQYLASVAGGVDSLLFRRGYADNFVKFCNALSTVLPPAGSRIRAVGTYNAGSTACVVNGGGVGSAEGKTPTGSSVMTVGNYGGNQAFLNGHLYQLSYFPQPVDGAVVTL